MAAPPSSSSPAVTAPSPLPPLAVVAVSVAALASSVAPGASAYKTYSLSTGENFNLDSFSRFEGALVARDEEEEEYANQAYRFLIMVHFSEDCKQCSKYLKELLHFKEIAAEKGYEVGYAAREYTDDADFMEAHLKDEEMKAEKPYVFEARDNNQGKRLFYEYTKDDLRTDGLSAKAFSEWLEGEFDLKGDAGMEAAMAAVEAEKGDGELSRLTDETFDYFVLRHNHSLVLVEPKNCLDCSKLRSQLSRAVRLGRRRVRGVGGGGEGEEDSGEVVAAFASAHSAPKTVARVMKEAGREGEGEGKDKSQAVARKGKVLYWADRMMYEYRGKARASSLVKFLLSQWKSPLLLPLSSAESVRRFNTGVGSSAASPPPRHTAVAFFPTASPKLLFEVQKAAAHSVAVPFGIAYGSSEDAFKEFEMPEEDYSVVLFDNVAGTREAIKLDKFAPEKKFREVRHLVLARSVRPLLLVDGAADVDLVLDENTDRAQVVVFMKETNAKLIKLLETDFAVPRRDRALTAVAVVGGNEEDGGKKSEDSPVAAAAELAKYFDLKPEEEELPTFRIRRRGKGDTYLKYKPEKPGLDLKEMSSMLEAVEKEDEAERPRPYARSRPKPEGWDEGNVTILVGKTFKAWAVDGDRNALVMFHDSSREGDPASQYSVDFGLRLLERLFASGEFSGADKDKAVDFATMDWEGNEALGTEQVLPEDEGLPSLPYFLYLGRSAQQRPIALGETPDYEGLRKFLIRRQKPAKEEL